APLRLLEDLLAPVHQAHPLLEGAEGVLQGELAALEPLHQLFQPVDELVVLLWRGGGGLRVLGHGSTFGFGLYRPRARGESAAPRLTQGGGRFRWTEVTVASTTSHPSSDSASPPIRTEMASPGESAAAVRTTCPSRISTA